MRVIVEHVSSRQKFICRKRSIGKMVLDIELFRADKGNDPLKVRQNQAKRFKDVTLVDKVVEADNKWRKCKLTAACG